jgi:hypothetical protein
MTRHSYIAALLFAGLLAGCGEKEVQSLTGIDPQARVKFFNFGVTAPSVNFYADATKVTAVQSTTGTESTTGVSFGGVAAGGAYTSIAPGQHALTGNIAATTDKDLPITTVSTTVEDGKFYSFYISGFYNSTTKTVESFIVQDDFPILPTDTTVAMVRFVHAISNANPMTLYAKKTTAGSTEVAVGAEVAYKNAGAFTSLPSGAYDLSTRFNGVATNAVARTGVSFVGGKVYTITARGDITVAPTTTGCAAANRTCLDNTSNR